MPESARELPTSRRRFAALLALTHALTDAPGLAEAARKVLAALGDAEGWSAGILWITPQPAGSTMGLRPGSEREGPGSAPYPEQRDCLRCVEVWSSPDRPAPDLDRVAREASILCGESLAGRAWAAG